MRRYVIALAMILATCQAHTLEGIRFDVPFKVENLANNGQLVPILEKFRDIMKHGNEKLGIPILDPLRLEHMDLNLKKEGMVELEGTMDNVRAKGLADFVVEKGDLAIIGLLAKVSLSWNNIDLMTKYKVTKGMLVDTFAFTGEGTIAAAIQGLQALVEMKLGIKDGKMFVKSLVLHAHLAKLDFEITGLYDDVQISKVMSKVISEMLPKLLEDYQDDVSKQGSPIVAEILDKILRNLSLSDILG